MKTKLIFLATIFVAFVFVSCSKEGDTQKPVIELHEPEDGDVFAPGSEFCIEMDLSDNNSLASFKIEIHNAFNGHTHSSSNSKHGTDELGDYNSDTANAFAYNKTSEQLEKSINGLKNTHQHLHIEIPALASFGDYHLMVYCSDADGNESYVARSISISDKGSSEHEHGHAH